MLNTVLFVVFPYVAVVLAVDLELEREVRRSGQFREPGHEVLLILDAFRVIGHKRGEVLVHLHLFGGRDLDAGREVDPLGLLELRLQPFGARRVLLLSMEFRKQHL
jgi:hypothetical protein